MWKQLLTYFYIRKRDPNEPRNFDLKMMHGMNRISILMFFVAIIIIIFRLITR